MNFNFSCKNYSSRVYTSFVIFVVLVTQSTAKLVLHFLDFSTILYGFYKLQSTHKRVKNHFAHRPLERLKCSHLCPSFAQKALELRGTLQCGPWAKGGGAAGRISAMPAAGMAGKR
jgi:hypothetical protein